VQQNGNSIRWNDPNTHQWTDEDTDRLIFYEWLYDENLEEYEVNADATDEFGLQAGEIVYVNSDKNWELPKQLQYVIIVSLARL
jgi:hypothetical protein